MTMARKGVACILQNSYKEFLEGAERFFDSFDFLSPLAAQVRELKAKIGKPFNIAIFGRMKAGKSSIVNAILGRDLAVTGVNETTATINIISRATSSEQCSTFEVHHKDNTVEKFPIERLSVDWTGKSDAVKARVERTAYIQLFSDAPSLMVNEIIDTPGTGAVVSDHEKVAQAFLDPSVQEGRKADALVYVFGVNGKESDEKDLKKFREGTLAQSFPYNSVGVLHRWDLTFWNSKGDWGEIICKCERLKKQLAGIVADVIPVSAPLARIAHRASDEQLCRVLAVACRSSKQQIETLLEDEDDWDDDDGRRLLKKEINSPWICFAIVVREAQKLGNTASPAALRRRLSELGGIDKLNTFLDRNFYKDSELIRQQNQYRKLEDIFHEAYCCIDERLEILNSDLSFWQILFDKQLQPDKLEYWIESKRMEVMSERDNLKKAAEAFDVRFRNSCVREILKDVDALTWCRINPSHILESEVTMIRTIFDSLAGGDGDVIEVGRLRELKKRILLIEGIVDADGRRNLRHLSKRLDLYLTSIGKYK